MTNPDRGRLRLAVFAVVVAFALPCAVMAAEPLLQSRPADSAAPRMSVDDPTGAAPAFSALAAALDSAPADETSGPEAPVQRVGGVTTVEEPAIRYISHTTAAQPSAIDPLPDEALSLPPAVTKTQAEPARLSPAPETAPEPVQQAQSVPAKPVLPPEPPVHPGVKTVRSVPASVLTDNVPRPISPAQATAHIRATKEGGAGDEDSLALAFNTQSTVLVKRGVNEMIPVAVNHVNRIVTPYAHPDVVTADLSSSDGSGGCGAICVKQNVVYVAPKELYPVTLFITEKGSQARAISITLVPRRIPPREVFLSFDDKAPNGELFAYNGPVDDKKAEQWEESQPFVETVTDSFRQIALGSIPRGYSFHKVPAGVRLPACEQAGLSFSFANGQYITGHHLIIYVGTARNVSDHPVEFREPVCGQWDVAAVSAWPRSVLSPNESTEVYVALQPNRRRNTRTRRPSLLTNTVTRHVVH